MGGPRTYKGNPSEVDTDESGTIERSELEVLWTNLGFSFTEEEKDTYIELYDLNSDGVITEEELVGALSSKHEAKNAIAHLFGAGKRTGTYCSPASAAPSATPSAAASATPSAAPSTAPSE